MELTNVKLSFRETHVISSSFQNFIKFETSPSIIAQFRLVSFIFHVYCFWGLVFHSNTLCIHCESNNYSNPSRYQPLFFWTTNNPMFELDTSWQNPLWHRQILMVAEKPSIAATLTEAKMKGIARGVWQGVQWGGRDCMGIWGSIAFLGKGWTWMNSQFSTWDEVWWLNISIAGSVCNTCVLWNIMQLRGYQGIVWFSRQSEMNYG